MALSRAASTMSKVKGLAVFDGVESALVGGTYSALELWKQTNIDYEVISLEVDGIYTANEIPQGEEAIFALPVVTPLNTIFASETFVAMAQCSKKHRQNFHYMGYVVLAKQYGTMRAFQIKQY